MGWFEGTVGEGRSGGLSGGGEGWRIGVGGGGVGAGEGDGEKGGCEEPKNRKAGKRK